MLQQHSVNKNEWKWSDGKAYERSNRTVISKEVKVEVNALSQALLSENDIWNLGDTNLSLPEEQYESNKREMNYNKMSEREMIGQIGANPYMPDNNYVNDVIARDTYMKPINTGAEAPTA